jgi:hypothetical protein
MVEKIRVRKYLDGHRSEPSRAYTSLARLKIHYYTNLQPTTCNQDKASSSKGKLTYLKVTLSLGHSIVVPIEYSTNFGDVCDKLKEDERSPPKFFLTYEGLRLSKEKLVRGFLKKKDRSIAVVQLPLYEVPVSIKFDRGFDYQFTVSKTIRHIKERLMQEQQMQDRQIIQSQLRLYDEGGALLNDQEILYDRKFAEDKYNTIKLLVSSLITVNFKLPPDPNVYEVSIEVLEEDTVLSLKHMLNDKFFALTKQLKLRLEGRLLANEETIASLRLSMDRRIELTLIDLYNPVQDDLDMPAPIEGQVVDRRLMIYSVPAEYFFRGLPDSRLDIVEVKNEDEKLSS